MANSPKLKATTLDHLVLYVRDVERSKKFYMDILGFEVAHEHLQASTVPPPPEEFDADIRSFLTCGQNQIGLFQRDTGGDTHGGDEFNHMALTLQEGEYDSVRAVLAEEGIEVRSRANDTKCIYISDPDGHNIQLLTVSEQHK